MDERTHAILTAFLAWLHDQDDMTLLVTGGDGYLLEAIPGDAQGIIEDFLADCEKQATIAPVGGVGDTMLTHSGGHQPELAAAAPSA